jgi:hypothetical protein
MKKPLDPLPPEFKAKAAAAPVCGCDRYEFRHTPCPKCGLLFMQCKKHPEKACAFCHDEPL